MKKQNKITKEELEIINNNQSELDVLLHKIGIVESQKHALLHNLAEVNRKVQEYKLLMEEKYGSINIDLKDGSYTNIKQ